MKILLLGEYSGYFTNLKKGLIQLGNECKLASSGDGWKKIDGYDYNIIHSDSKSLIKRLYYHIIHPLIHRKEYFGYDIVYMISTQIFSPHINKFMFNLIKRNNKKVFLTVAGGCHSLYKSYAEGKLGYYTFDNNPELVAKFDGNNKNSKTLIKQENYIYKNVNGIIPIMYEYSIGVTGLHNFIKTVPLPFDLSSVEYTKNIVVDKIKIFHGVIREKSKGTDIIKKALEIIKERYSNEVEIIIDGKKPLKQYLQLLDTVNILVDQCKEHCYGMNALYAMAKGRIVLGGASEKSLLEYGLDSSPVFHIEPDVNQIVNQLENVIRQNNNFEKIGYESRRYVEINHDCKIIAQKYIDLWSKE